LNSQFISNYGLTNRTYYVDLSDGKTFEIHTAISISYYQTQTVIYKFNTFVTYLWETSGYSRRKRFNRINVKCYTIFLITISTFIIGKRLWLYPHPVFSDLTENSSAGFLSLGSKASQPLIGQYFGNLWNENDIWLKLLAFYIILVGFTQNCWLRVHS